MAKAPVLGNDPFQRGAAPREGLEVQDQAVERPRTPAPSDAPAPSPEPTPAASPAPAPAPRQSRRKASQAGQKPRPERRSPRPKAKPTRNGPDAPAGDASTAMPSAVPADLPAPPSDPELSARPGVESASQTESGAASELSPETAPLPQDAPLSAAEAEFSPEPEPEFAPEPDAHPGEAQPEGTALEVIEGELVDDTPLPPLRQPTASGRPPHPPWATSRDLAPSPALASEWLSRARTGPSHALGDALRSALSSDLARRAADAVAQTPLFQRALEAAAAAASATAPARAFAARHLPLALDATRRAASAVSSGAALKALVSLAVDAGDAARRVARKVEPSTYEVDPFGEDPRLVSRLEPLFDFLHDRYFRMRALGVERIPAGPCLLICNHSGALPWDGPMIRTVLRRDGRRLDARWLIEDTLFHAPFLGVWLNRLGAVRACPENALRLLEQGVALAVFPEGLLGIRKPLASRYRLQRFGRGGFVKLALRARVPLLPVAVFGAEESSPLLGRIPLRSLGMPYLPLTLPLPLPARWTVSVLPPVDLTGYPAEKADDPGLVSHLTAQVRDAIQAELDRLLSMRQSVLAG